MEYIIRLLIQLKINPDIANILSQIILLTVVTVLSIIGNLIVKSGFIRMIPRYLSSHRIDWAKIMMEKNVFRRLSYIVSGLIIYLFSSQFPLYEEWIRQLASAYMLGVGIFVLDALLNSLNEIYSNYSISKLKPIKGYIQIIKIFIYITGGIVLVSTAFGKNPYIFLSGVGALTAVFLLIFRDSLLGLVAGIQLSANDMVRLGDWIEMHKYDADGSVVDISLNTVKVQNFDKTISTIPTYALISDSFKNWRGMAEAGARRIKRAIYIDVSSVCFCTDEMIEKFKKIQYIQEYTELKQKELEEYNYERGIDTSNIINGKHMTNIGTFRVYIESYLKNHPKIHKDMTIVVRQLPSGEHGLPLEIYAFSTDIDMQNYEKVQADVFDHILAIIPHFGLRIFQHPTGHDMKTVFGNTN